MAKKTNSFSQFDGGAGSKAAKRGKAPREPKVDNRTTRTITRNGNPGRRIKTESEVMADMKAHRRAVLRGGN